MREEPTTATPLNSGGNVQSELAATSKPADIPTEAELDAYLDVRAEALSGEVEASKPSGEAYRLPDVKYVDIGPLTLACDPNPDCRPHKPTPHPTGGATPRTDAITEAARYFKEESEGKQSELCMVVDAAFARQLETELTQAKAEIAKANAQNREYHAMTNRAQDERDKSNESLTAERAKCAELEKWKEALSENELSSLEWIRNHGEKEKQQAAEIARLREALEKINSHPRDDTSPEVFWFFVKETIEKALAAGREGKL